MIFLTALRHFFQESSFQTVFYELFATWLGELTKILKAYRSMTSIIYREFLGGNMNFL
jgi:hypothetical protein